MISLEIGWARATSLSLSWPRIASPKPRFVNGCLLIQKPTTNDCSGLNYIHCIALWVYRMLIIQWFNYPERVVLLLSIFCFSTDLTQLGNRFIYLLGCDEGHRHTENQR